MNHSLRYALVCAAAVFAVSLAKESLQGPNSITEYAPSKFNGTAPGPLTDVHLTWTKPKAIVVSWRTPITNRTTFVQGYDVQHRLRENKSWTLFAVGNFTNATNSLTFPTTASTTGYDIYITPYNWQYDKSRPVKKLYGPTTHKENGASGLIASAFVTTLLTLFVTKFAVSS